jgi:hypothetical protein
MGKNNKRGGPCGNTDIACQAQLSDDHLAPNIFFPMMVTGGRRDHVHTRSGKLHAKYARKERRGI